LGDDVFVFVFAAAAATVATASATVFDRSSLLLRLPTGRQISAAILWAWRNLISVRRLFSWIVMAAAASEVSFC
jgi:hypothetical protein